MSKAQIAVEYLLISGFALLILIPAVYFLVSYSASAQEDIARAQIQEIGNQILSTAEKAYYLGKNNRLSLDVTWPSGINDLTLYCTYPAAGKVMYDHCELVVIYSDEEIVFTSRIPLINSTLPNYDTVKYTYKFDPTTYSAGKKKVTLTTKQDTKQSSGPCTLAGVATVCYPVAANSCVENDPDQGCYYSGIVVQMTIQ